MLSRKATALEEHMREAADENIHPLRFELNSYFFTQLIAGPPRSPVFTLMLEIIMWMTLVAVPVLVLVYFQVSFLPFHDEFVTWA